MIQLRFNLEKTYRNAKASKEAKELQKQGKKPKASHFHDRPTAINLSCTVNQKYLKVNTGRKVLPKNFSLDNQKILSGHDGDSVKENLILGKIRSNAQEAIDKLLFEGKDITFQKVKSIIIRAVRGDNEFKEDKSFFTYYDEFLAYKKTRISHLTMKKYNTVKVELKDFEEFIRKPLEFDLLSNRLFDDYQQFLVDTKGVCNNTIVKSLKCIRCYLNYCKDNEISNCIDRLKFDTSEYTKEPFVLSEDEILAIYKLEDLPKALERTRDVFIFMCYTGQRHSDIARLKWNDLSISESGNLIWKVYQKKTGSTKPTIVPILPIAKELIDKYRVNNIDDEQAVFPVPSTVTMNKYLKQIARLANLANTYHSIKKVGNKNIDEYIPRVDKLTSHVARKSFITLAIQKGLDIPTIQRISGHSDPNSMRPYINVSTKHIEEALLGKF